MTTRPVPPPLIGPAQLASLADEGWFALEDVLGLQQAREARVSAGSLRSSMSPSGMGRGHERSLDASGRGDLSLWLEPADVPAGLEPALALFERLRLEVNHEAWLGLDRLELQLACYPGGGETYARHRDSFRGDGDARRLTAIYYLNEGWQPADGGSLRLFLASGDRDIEPRADRLLVFMSAEVEHAVLPALAERWALTAWHSGASRLPGA